MSEPIVIRNPRCLPAGQIEAERVAVGLPGDYKPMVVQLPGGELLLTAFRGRDVDQRLPSGRAMMHEDVLLFRSSDGGRTWGRPTVCTSVLPREPYLAMLSDGTLLMTIHFHGRDHRNLDRVVQTYIYRSTDRGQTWQGRHVVPDEYPPAIWIHSARNPLELADGSVILGVSGLGQADLIYRSGDQGSYRNCRYRSG